MKKLLALCLSVLLLVSLVGCHRAPAVQTSAPTTLATEATTEATTQATEATEPEQTASAVTPLIYEVTDDAGNRIWLFGSIHVGRENFYPLPDYVMEAFDAAEALAVEFDIVAFEQDLPGQIAALQALIYTDGTTIKDHISQDLYTRSVQILTDAGLYSPLLDYYAPVLWSSFLDNAALGDAEKAAELGVDLTMIQQAYEQEKPVLSIESAQSQYGMMAGFSPALQANLLESSILSYEMGMAQIQTEMLLDSWAEGNPIKFEILLANPTVFESEEDARLYAEYQDAMITQRDLLMTDYAETALKEGKQLFICVGAAHVLGENAMLDQLQARGYTVTCLKPEA